MERRQAPRRMPDPAEPMAAMRVRTGGTLVVQNVSNGGALVEGIGRLLPGTHVDVHVVTAGGRVLVRSRVLRAAVSHVAAGGVRYQGALRFDRPIDAAPCGYLVPESSAADAPAPGTDYPCEHPRRDRPAETSRIREG